MKLKELVNTDSQIKKPSSPGSRGLRLNKKNPGKRYFDYTTKLPKTKSQK